MDINIHISLIDGSHAARQAQLSRGPLRAGRYEYKFVIDGKAWRPDPGNDEQAGFYHNSVLHVGR